MRETDRWLSDYGDSHQDISCPAIYWAAVLVLVPGVTGMLWSLPTPAAFAQISPLLNWGSAFLMASLVYYFIISLPLAIGMLPFMLGVAALGVLVARAEVSVAGVSLGVVVIALAGLYFGHHAGGGMRAVVRDIQLMMIGPAWLLSRFYRRLGIPF
jgi:Protein of unknown function (DUF962)